MRTLIASIERIVLNIARTKQASGSGASGIGLVGATAIVAYDHGPKAFRSGRVLAKYLD